MHQRRGGTESAAHRGSTVLSVRTPIRNKDLIDFIEYASQGLVLQNYPLMGLVSAQTILSVCQYFYVQFEPGSFQLHGFTGCPRPEFWENR